MDDVHAVNFDDEHGILPTFHAFDLVVKDADGLDVNVPKRLVDGVPVLFLAGSFEPEYDFGFVAVFHRLDLRMVVVEMADQDEVGADQDSAVNVYRMRVGDDARSLARNDFKK